MTYRATCTWGEGPDVMLIIEETKGNYFPHDNGPIYQYNHEAETFQRRWFDLTAEQALNLSAQLAIAANHAKEQDRLLDTYFIEEEKSGNLL